MYKKCIFLVFILASLLASSLSSSIYNNNQLDDDMTLSRFLENIESNHMAPGKRNGASAPRVHWPRNAKRVITPDEKLQKMTLAFIKYLQFLKSNQVDSNMKKVILLQVNELMEEMQRHLNDYPELEQSIVKMIKNPAALLGDNVSGQNGDDGKNKDVTPFKWGK